MWHQRSTEEVSRCSHMWRISSDPVYYIQNAVHVQTKLLVHLHTSKRLLLCTAGLWGGLSGGRTKVEP